MEQEAQPFNLEAYRAPLLPTGTAYAPTWPRAPIIVGSFICQRAHVGSVTLPGYVFCVCVRASVCLSVRLKVCPFVCVRVHMCMCVCVCVLSCCPCVHVSGDLGG